MGKIGDITKIFSQEGWALASLNDQIVVGDQFRRVNPTFVARMVKLGPKKCHPSKTTKMAGPEKIVWEVPETFTKIQLLYWCCQA